MGRYVTLATCNLNQWALDFDGNCSRILESIRVAKQRGARLRVGPELEICGYGCLDHFAEQDLYDHSWEAYASILQNPATHGILLDIGMPILHKLVKYNCRVLSFDGRVLMIRPKLWLANDGNYREMRYFTPWNRPRYWEEYRLPEVVDPAAAAVPFGDCVLDTRDTALGCETCEELFTPQLPHIGMALDGVEIFTNSSGSHHELRKLDTRLGLISEATKKCGGVYLYLNQRGCDGDRLYYDGCACIVVNGRMLAQALQFLLADVEVVTATVDLEDVRGYRNQKLAQLQLVQPHREPYHRVRADFLLAPPLLLHDPRLRPTVPLAHINYHLPEEEIALGPACWLWDYLRRSRCGGYFLPLSGGIDSCATAVIVHLMCRLVVAACRAGDRQVLEDVQRICQQGSDWAPALPQQIALHVFYSSFMGTENSLAETRSRAKQLAQAIGLHHIDMNMDTLVSSVVTVFEVATGRRPIFKVFGGSQTENLALQNIQARLRMVLAYLFAQLLPWTRGRDGAGLLVLGSANVDECLRGYLTKYDCLSADVNPIGGVSKTDLKRFIKWAATKFEMPLLHEFLEATPTAELEPITKDYVQSDEVDMGMTYDELLRFGRLRKVDKCGPYTMFIKLYHEWLQPPLLLTAQQVADKVKRFWFFYAINRHKMTTMTPAYHAEQYLPDDNRFDLRPFLINPRFPWASRRIDEAVRLIEERSDEVERSNLSVD